MEKKINITSTAVEKGLDMARSFLSKLISPAVEEAGLLIKDRITYWRFRNQVKVLNKAQVYCVKNNISTKAISLKLMVPLLENASLEEDEFMQDKWAVLLGNLVDSSQNIENHVFPYLLSQISISEFTVLEETLKSRNTRIEALNNEIKTFEEEHWKFVETYNSDRTNLMREIELRRNNNILNPKNYIPIQDLESSLKHIRFKKELMDNHKVELTQKLKEPEQIGTRKLKDYEYSNLIRLGIIQVITKSYVKSETLEIPNEPDSEYLMVDLDIKIHTDHENHVLTQLGELFIQACSDKRVSIDFEMA